MLMPGAAWCLYCRDHALVRQGTQQASPPLESVPHHDTTPANHVTMDGLVVIAGTHFQHDNGSLNGAVDLQVAQHDDAIDDERQAAFLVGGEVGAHLFAQE